MIKLLPFSKPAPYPQFQSDDQASVISSAPYYLSHGINRNDAIYEKIETIQTCDFYSLTKDSWNKNKRYWP